MSTREEIRYDGQQQDREDKRRARLEEMSRRGGPDAPDECEGCHGRGHIFLRDKYHAVEQECGRCLGTGVQP